MHFVSAVMVSIFHLRSVSVSFFIKTAVYGRCQFLWFQMLIMCTTNSEN